MPFAIIIEVHPNAFAAAGSYSFNPDSEGIRRITMLIPNGQIVEPDIYLIGWVAELRKSFLMVSSLSPYTVSI